MYFCFFLQRPWVAWWHKLFASLESVIGLMFFFHQNMIFLELSLKPWWWCTHQAHGFSRKEEDDSKPQVLPSNHKLKKGEMASFPSKKQHQSLCCSRLICKLLLKKQDQPECYEWCTIDNLFEEFGLPPKNQKTNPCDQQKQKSEKAWRAHV